MGAGAQDHGSRWSGAEQSRLKKRGSYKKAKREELEDEIRKGNGSGVKGLNANLWASKWTRKRLDPNWRASEREEREERGERKSWRSVCSQTS